WTEFVHFDEGSDFISDFRLAVVGAGFLQRNFGFGIADRLDDDLLRDNGYFAGLRVDLDLDVLILAEPLFRGGLQGCFDGTNHFGFIDALLTADLVDDGDEFSVHGWLSTSVPPMLTTSPLSLPRRSPSVQASRSSAGQGHLPPESRNRPLRRSMFPPHAIVRQVAPSASAS